METSDVLSLIAIGISIISAFIVYKQTDKNNKINLQSIYFEEIYKDHLINKIPEARRHVEFVCGKLTGTDYLVDELNKIRSDSLYFYYNNDEFYKELKKIMQSLEDYIMPLEGRTFEADKQEEINAKIKDSIEQIYTCINKVYFGKK